MEFVFVFFPRYEFRIGTEMDGGYAKFHSLLDRRRKRGRFRRWIRVGRFRSHWRSTMYEVIFVITGYRETMDRVGAINTDGPN